MWRELLDIFRLRSGEQPIGELFDKMLRTSLDHTRRAGDIYFGAGSAKEERDKLHRRDARINKLERKIRKRVLVHLSTRKSVTDIPYCLLLISLTKDVERIGDYAKNLTEVGEFCPTPIPESAVLAKLKVIREKVEAALDVTPEVFAGSDYHRAVTLLIGVEDSARMCDALLPEIAKSGYDSGVATALVLGARYYKRIASHLMNILSSIVVPLHRVDYFDRERIGAAAVASLAKQ